MLTAMHRTAARHIVLGISASAALFGCQMSASPVHKGMESNPCPAGTEKLAPHLCVDQNAQMHVAVDHLLFSSTDCDGQWWDINPLRVVGESLGQLVGQGDKRWSHIAPDPMVVLSRGNPEDEEASPNRRFWNNYGTEADTHIGNYRRSDLDLWSLPLPISLKELKSGDLSYFITEHDGSSTSFHDKQGIPATLPASLDDLDFDRLPIDESPRPIVAFKGNTVSPLVCDGPEQPLIEMQPQYLLERECVHYSKGHADDHDNPHKWIACGQTVPLSLEPNTSLTLRFSADPGVTSATLALEQDRPSEVDVSTRPACQGIQKPTATCSITEGCSGDKDRHTLFATPDDPKSFSISLHATSTATELMVTIDCD